MVGISLLTLVPGELGGSETYVRELLRASRRTASSTTACSCRPLAPELAAGLPSEVAAEYRAGTDDPAAPARDDDAAARPGPLRARLAGADVVHYPLTLRIPPVAPAVRRRRCSTCSTSTCRQLFSRHERAFRAVAWHRSVRGADRVIVISEFVRDRAVALLGLDPERIRVIHLGVDHERLPARRRGRASRSSSTPPGPGRTRTTRGSSRRSRCCGASAPTCGSC